MATLAGVVGWTGIASGEDETSGYGEGAYGAGGFGGSDPECFIATAAYDDAHPTVGTLRAFRDDVLDTNPIGRSCIRLYYAISPPVARWIGRTERRRRAVRTLLAPITTAANRFISTS